MDESLIDALLDVPESEDFVDKPPPRHSMVIIMIFCMLALVTCAGAADQTDDVVWVIPVIHLVCVCLVMCTEKMTSIIMLGIQMIGLFISLHCHMALAWIITSIIGIITVAVNWLLYKKYQK